MQVRHILHGKGRDIVAIAAMPAWPMRRSF